MNHSYPHGPLYSSQYAPNNSRLPYQQLPTTSTSAAVTNGQTPQTHLAHSSATNSAHTLPPISSADYASSLRSDVFSSRAEPLQPTLMTAEPHHFGQPGPTPVYGPTSTTFFNPTPQPNAFSQPGLTPQTYRTTAGPTFSNLPAHSNAAYPSMPRPPVRLLDIRPMPINVLNNASGHQTPNGTPPGSAARVSGDLDDAPVHVVGSQGRRGILPSANGRPSALLEDGADCSKNAANPTKDASGKYPCQHCPKNYLHAKHLKRHMLRHTGHRPYSCGLCKDTFSRSDILKRHFQKCSARRGNPTGETHLAHSRANKQRMKQEQQQAAANTLPMTVKNEAIHSDSAQSSATFTPAGYDQHLDLRNLDLGQAHFQDPGRPLITPMSRSNSMKKPKTSQNSSHRNSLSAAPTSAYDGNMGYSTGQVTPDSITTSGAATPYNYPHETRSNQITPDGPIHRTASGVALGSAPGTRPPVATHYSTGSLPHIVGQANGRGPDLDWNSYSHFQFQDDFAQHALQNGSMTPQNIKSELSFDNLAPNMSFNSR